MKGAGMLLFVWAVLATRVTAEGLLSIAHTGSTNAVADDVRKEMKSLLREEMDAFRSEMEAKFQEISQEIQELKLASGGGGGRDMLMTMYMLRQQKESGKKEISYENGNMTILMVQLMTELSYGLSAAKLRQFGDGYLKIGGNMHAILLYYVAGLKDRSAGDQGVMMKQFAVQDIRLAVLKIQNTSHEYNLAKRYALPLMEDLLAGLRGKVGASRRTKAEYQSWTLKDIGLSYGYFGDFVNLFVYSKLGLETMEAEFDRFANRYRVYSICLVNCGVAKQHLGDIKAALTYYEDGLKAMEAVTDFPDPEGKAMWIQETKDLIDVAKKLLG